MKKTEETNKSTFVVKINNKQNGTWQGRVIWAEENRTEHFRSLLELINLMDEALARGELISFGERGIG